MDNVHKSFLRGKRARAGDLLRYVSGLAGVFVGIGHQGFPELGNVNLFVVGVVAEQDFKRFILRGAIVFLIAVDVAQLLGEGGVQEFHDLKGSAAFALAEAVDGRQVDAGVVESAVLDGVVFGEQRHAAPKMRHFVLGELHEELADRAVRLFRCAEVMIDAQAFICRGVAQ